MQVKQANIRTQEAQESLERAQEEQEVLAHAAAQHDELLEQLTSLRISLSQAQADIAGKEDELQESRACLDRLVCPSLCHTTLPFFQTLPFSSNGRRLVSKLHEMTYYST